MSIKVSKKEMEKEMEIKTKESMFNLGIQHSLNNINKKNKLNKLNNIKNELFISQNLDISNCIELLDNMKINDWKNIFNNFNIFYTKNKKNLIYNFYYLINYYYQNEIKLKKEIKLLNESIEDLNENSNNTIYELDNLERQYKMNEFSKTKIYKKVVIIEHLILICLSIIIFQNFNLILNIFNFYFNYYTYYITKSFFDTNYIFLNILFFVLLNFITTCLSIFSYNLYKKYNNINIKKLK